MSQPFVGEIKMFGGNFAPRAYALCDGQLMVISTNSALFSLLGTIYGGDGRTTFALPDLRGRVPVHQGHGPGLSERRIGSKGGQERVTLTTNQLPSHEHVFSGSSAPADQDLPAGHVLATLGASAYAPGGFTKPLSWAAVSSAGGSQAHDNIQPTLAVHFIIALFGIYPSRN